MSEWGIPDWTDASAYGDTEAWHDFRWRWEFTRRREDYRADFEAIADWTFEHYRELYSGEFGRKIGVDAEGVLKPDDIGFEGQATAQQAYKYGYAGLPNPRHTELRSYAPTFRKGAVAFIKGEGDRLFGEPMSSAGDGEMLVRFDLDQPLAAQIAAVERELAIYQEMRHGKKLETRKHRRTWFAYLRVLDGKEAGASWSEIFDVVLRPTKPGNKNPAQEARNVWDAARALMFNWPD